MDKKHFGNTWSVYNYPDKGAGNAYKAEMSAMGNTLRNEDITQVIVKERSEYRNYVINN